MDCTTVTGVSDAEVANGMTAIRTKTMGYILPGIGHYSISRGRGKTKFRDPARSSLVLNCHKSLTLSEDKRLSPVWLGTLTADGAGSSKHVTAANLFMTPSDNLICFDIRLNVRPGQNTWR
jgi:hypothetical protein